MTGDPARRGVEIFEAAAFGDHVAGLLADRLTARPSLVVCLPTGSTLRPFARRPIFALHMTKYDEGGADPPIGPL